MSGRLIAVVGPSGVGKDSVIDALCLAHPALFRVKRCITRPTEAGGEAFHGLDLPEFQRRKAAGDFVLSWGAHELHYGIPNEVTEVLGTGRDAIVNLSRGVLLEAREKFDTLHVIWLTARPEVLAARLVGRGRETAQDIARRLAREGASMPADLKITQVRNDGALADTVAEIDALYFPVRV